MMTQDEMTDDRFVDHKIKDESNLTIMRATRIYLCALLILMSTPSIRALVVRFPSVQRSGRITRLFGGNVPRHRQRREADPAGTPSTLEWNSFEFGQRLVLSVFSSFVSWLQ